MVKPNTRVMMFAMMMMLLLLLPMIMFMMFMMMMMHVVTAAIIFKLSSKQVNGSMKMVAVSFTHRNTLMTITTRIVAVTATFVDKRNNNNNDHLLRSLHH